MVAYDYSKEPNNPWDTAHWNPKAQIDFMRRVKTDNAYNGSAPARIAQRIAQSDTKGMPPRILSASATQYPVIVQRRYMTPSVYDLKVGFGLAGPVVGRTQWTLPVVTQRMTFPSAKTTSDARCDSAPTADATLVLSDELNNVLCTVTFAAGSTVGTFAWSAPAGYIVQPNQLLYLFADGASDATFGGINLAFIGSSVPS